jgi:hypothetical protein
VPSSTGEVLPRRAVRRYQSPRLLRPASVHDAKQVRGQDDHLLRLYPPGSDEAERRLSGEILAWTRNNAPDSIGALRVQFRSVKVGIVARAKTPFVCGEVREPGAPWHRFAVYSIGARAEPPTPTFFWLSEPRRKVDVKEFCDVTQEDLQWYVVPTSSM